MSRRPNLDPVLAAAIEKLTWVRGQTPGLNLTPAERDRLLVDMGQSPENVDTILSLETKEEA